MHATPQEKKRTQGPPDPSEWVDRYGEKLLQYAAARVGDPATAEDLVQETLLIALKNLDKYRGQAAFRTWLVAILKRKIADHYRRNARKGATVDTDTVTATEFKKSGSWAEAPYPWRATGKSPPSSPEQIAENAEFWGVLSGCVSQMPEHLARAFRQRTIAGADQDAVCSSEGITKKNLSVRLHRARLMVRRCLEKTWFTDAN